MSYADAVHRVSDLRERLGFEPNVRSVTNGNFDQVLATANNRFDVGPAKLDVGSSVVPAGQFPPSASAPNAIRAMTHTKGLTPELSKLIDRAATEFGVPKQLVTAVIKAESDFDPNSGSSAGAKGLMQLMPETAREVGVTDVMDSWQNVRGGTRYLKKMLDQFHGDVKLGLAAYNAGPGNVEKYGGIPPFQETQTYVARVLKYAGQFGWKP